MKLTKLIIITALTMSNLGYGQVREKLLIGGCGWDYIAIIDKESKEIEWSHHFTENEDCNDLEITANGDILYAYNRGARLISQDQKVIWDFKVNPGEELYTAHQLPSGNFMLAMCGTPPRIATLNPYGILISQDTINVGIEHVHGQFRQIVRSDDGGYIIPLMAKGQVVELDNKFNEIRRVECGGSPFSVLQSNGNWLVSCGDGHRLVEINPIDGIEVRNISSEQLSDTQFFFVAETIRYPNGNLLISNWNGHTQDKSQPLLVEVSPEGQVIWTLMPSTDIVNISAVHSFYK